MNADERAWNPALSLEDRKDQLPILTPVFPQTNVTAKITKNTKQIFKGELEAGRKNLEKDWATFFEPYNPFNGFDKFILIKAELKGMVSTKIISLVSKLEDKCSKVRLLPRVFQNETTALWLVGYVGAEEIDLCEIKGTMV